MSFHPYFFAIFSRSGSPTHDSAAWWSAHISPAACDSFKRVHDWWKAGWRRSGAPPPTQQKSWLLRWLSKPIIKLELSESCCSMYTKCIQCQYHTHNLLSIYWIQWTVIVYFWKLLIAISTYMTCDFAHSMVNMWCNSCILVAFYRWHSEWHMYKVSTTWMHFMKLNIVATNFDCDFLETWVLRHLLSSTEPHFLVSRQNCLNFLTQYLDNILDTMDRAVFWTYCLFSRNEPCMYTDCSVLGKPFFNN